jgi:rhamnose transport system permease protein
MKRLGALLGRWEALLVLLLAGTAVLGAALSPTFASKTTLSLVTADLMEKAIMAVPLTMIIIAGQIDLSVASILGLASAVLGALVAAGVPLWLAILVALVVGAACGGFNGLLVTGLQLPSLVVTLGTLALFRGLASVVLGDRAVSDFPAAFTEFGFGNVPGTLVPWPFVVFAVLALAGMVVLHGSVIGRQLYAVGNNPEAARFSGVPIRRLLLGLYVASGVCSAIAGVVFTARFASARADNALGFELDVITAVLLGGVSIFGGRGSLPGVVLALFVIGGLRSALALADVPSEVQSIAVGTLLVLSVLGPGVAERVREGLRRRRLAARGGGSGQPGGLRGPPVSEGAPGSGGSG